MKIKYTNFKLAQLRKDGLYCPTCGKKVEECKYGGKHPLNS